VALARSVLTRRQGIAFSTQFEPAAEAAGGIIRPWHIPSRDEATGSFRSRLEEAARRGGSNDA